MSAFAMLWQLTSSSPGQMVRYHFGDKKGLYDDVIRYVVDAETRARILAQVSQNAEKPEDALRRSVHAVLTQLIH